MNTLTHGFLYTAGMGWALCEVCVMASNGNWFPLIIFLAAFIVVFAVIGCLPVSDSRANTFGNIFAIVLGFVLLAFAYTTRDLGMGITVLKFGGAILVAGMTFLTRWSKRCSRNCGIV